MKVFALWHGGSSYSVGGLESLEKFDSLADAKEEFYRRYEWGSGDFQYVDETEYITSGPIGTPCVERTETDPETGDRWGTEMWVFLGDIEDIGRDGDLYTDRIIFFGPQMGVRIERT